MTHDFCFFLLYTPAMDGWKENNQWSCITMDGRTRMTRCVSCIIAIAMCVCAAGLSGNNVCIFFRRKKRSFSLVVHGDFFSLGLKKEFLFLSSSFFLPLMSQLFALLNGREKMRMKKKERFIIIVSKHY